ncbi:MAG: hypothetical protein JOZ52_13670 [Acidobacteria bacterium]|nr:hypothetical protein [Acidobacteriota bacterium]
MLIFAFEGHLIWSRTNADGSVTRLIYYDFYTWIVCALVLAWLVWFLIRRHRRARAMRRQPRRKDSRPLKRLVKIKQELSSNYLRPGFSNNIHAVGIGKLVWKDEYCIQVFVNDATQELWAGSGAAATALPASYRGVTLVLIEMAFAGFLSEQSSYGIRERQEIIIGGISGANTNLTGQSGTIGYFCTRKSSLPRRKQLLMLSNSHVFADLSKAKVDDTDLIMQPSPGERAGNRPIGALVNYSALKFNSDLADPNHIDAAIAKLWNTQPHKPLIPHIGACKGYVAKEDVEVGEAARKFGRTTCYTEGSIFSIYLDIWIYYDRTGQSAFFQNQFLIEPASPQFSKFAAKGDSGALVVDEKQHALGLIFAGTAELPEKLRAAQNAPAPNPPPQRIEGYGVANPISEVLERLKIELLV